MLREFFARRRKEKALEDERELLNREHDNRLRNLQYDHDRRVFELFENCCTIALEEEHTGSDEMWAAIRAQIQAAKAQSDRIQDDFIAALNAEHQQFMDSLHALYNKYEFKLTDN